MAYNTTGVTPGSGKSVSFDDNVQRVKVAFGPEGTQSDVSPDNRLPITSSAHDEDIGKIVAGNVREKWKVGFSSLETANFDLSKDSTDLAFADGNVAGSSWVDLCKSATAGGTETVYLGKKAFKVPYSLELGLGLSQRFNGQEFYAEMVGVNADADGNVSSVIASGAAVPDLDISASIVVSANTWSVTCSTSTTHLRPGDWICIYGCADSRLNVGPVLITANSSAQNNLITFVSTLADSTYTGYTGGKIRFICHCGLADYHHGLRFWGTSSNNADTISRNGSTDPSGGNGNRARVVNWNPGNGQTDAAIPNEGGLNYSGVQYTRSFRSKGVWRTEHTTGYLAWQSKDQDSTSAVRSQSHRESEVPAQDQWYALRYRALNLPNLSVPVGSSLAITAISKSGTTTATVTCPGHGLNANSRVRIYGVRDQTNFANLTSDTQVASIVSADQFTIVLGSAVTASSYGGAVVLIHGGAVPTLTTIVVQTYNRSYDSLRLVLIGNGTWADVVGNIVTLCGLVDAGGVALTSLQGRYRVARQTGTTLELDPMDGQEAAIAAAPASATNAGGTIIRNTSYRLHYARVLDYVRLLIEPTNSAQTEARSVPVRVNNSLTILPGGATWATATPVTNRSAAVHWGAPASNSDVTSAARTSSGNSGTISDDIAGTVSGIVNVSAIGGTPTLDLVLKESFDNGTTWQDAWHVERITGTGTKRIPPLPVSGRRRWDWTIGGTSPSLTFTITAMRGGQATPIARCYYDRTAALIAGTASTNGAAFDIVGCKVINAAVCIGAATTPATYQLELSNDGANWTKVGTATAAVANSTVRFGVSDVSACFARVVVTSGATAQTGTYVSITAGT